MSKGGTCLCARGCYRLFFLKWLLKARPQRLIGLFIEFILFPIARQARIGAWAADISRRAFNLFQFPSRRQMHQSRLNALNTRV